MRIILGSLFTVIAFLLTACSQSNHSFPKSNEATSWTVTFDSQDATVSAVPAFLEVTEPATTISLPSNPVKDNYEFGGWYQ